MFVPISRGGRAFLALLLATVAAGLLASVAMPPAEAAFPGANGVIAFASRRTTGAGVTNPTGDYELFTMNPDGNGLFQITDNTTDESDPAWSAVGQWLAYSSAGEIYIRRDRIALEETRRLTTNTATDSNPTFSPDVSKIAFVSHRDGNFEIYVMDTADSDHDGNGDHLTRLTTKSASDAYPAWSPDGTRIAFTSHRDGNTEVFVMAAAPEGAGNLPVNLTNTAGFDIDPAWSPDGRKIAYTSEQDGNANIYVMNTDGSGPTRLTNKAVAEFAPAWSPDGTKIAFTTTRGGGDAEIYVMKAKPESKQNRPRNRTTNGEDDFGPDWRPIP